MTRHHHGTTSACAENTTKLRFAQLTSGNYLRVRGEYFVVTYPTATRLELPPRARRIRSQGTTHTGSNGTTSACAENTALPLGMDRIYRNYLRVRGEYLLVD